MYSVFFLDEGDKYKEKCCVCSILQFYIVYFIVVVDIC